MRIAAFAGLVWVGAILGAGCDGASSTRLVGGTQNPQNRSVDVDPLSPSFEPNGPPSDIPCEALTALSKNCHACHSNPPVGAPFSLVSSADFTRASPTDPGQTIAQRAKSRIHDPDFPMPPASRPRPSSLELAAIDAWLDAGAPVGESCADGNPVPPPPAEPPPPALLVCTSGRFWDVANTYDGDEKMNPGLACITCHAANEGPSFHVGGTVYPTLHENDRCYGVEAIGRVEVTDAEGRIYSAAINAYGNFRIDRSAGLMTFPIRAKVISSSGSVREMPIPAPHGNCNACHTEQGANGAPGRILAP
jgi:hypothetical protein